jgi:serine/threonine protein kinase
VAHVKEKFPSPKKYLPNCPKEVEHIINKCTRKNPKERYASAQELYNDLLNLKNNPSAIKEKKGFFSRIFGFK